MQYASRVELPKNTVRLKTGTQAFLNKDQVLAVSLATSTYPWAGGCGSGGVVHENWLAHAGRSLKIVECEPEI